MRCRSPLGDADSGIASGPRACKWRRRSESHRQAGFQIGLMTATLTPILDAPRWPRGGAGGGKPCPAVRRAGSCRQLLPR